MATGEPDSSKVILRADLSSRIREALEMRDWAQMEHWAKQWIQLDPKCSSGFKWLARAAVATKQMGRAAYAYGRLLDFEPDNEEPRKFFAQYPSTLTDQPQSVSQSLKKGSGRPGEPIESHALNPDQRKNLASEEFHLAETYAKYRLHGEAAAHFLKSHDWHANQAAALGAAKSLHSHHRGLEAIRFLKQQLYHFPDWVEGRLLLGKILFELGHRTDAQREWQTVLEYDAKNAEALQFLRGIMSASI